jgi:N-methylhydantoinase A
MDVAALDRWFAHCEADARGELAQRGADLETIVCVREYDARYRGQSFELTIAGCGAPDAVAARFHRMHRERYGYDVPGETVEVVNARLRASGALPRGAAPGGAATTSRSAATASTAPRTRAVWMDEGWAEVPALARQALIHGQIIDGPAIVEEYDCTTYVAPGWRLAANVAALELECRS